MTNDGLVFEQLSDTVLEVRDTISNQQYRIESSESMEVEPTDYDDFPGPVSETVSINATDLHLPVFYAGIARDEDGSMDTTLTFDSERFRSTGGPTFIELQTPIKSYLRIDGAFEYETTSDDVTINLASTSDVRLGSRAWRCYPTETITVSPTPTDLREAISHFGDKIMTSSAERSFSTLRGHPPRLRTGDSLDIPSSLKKPDSGISITLPETIPSLLAVAPLAYYLLATVEPGEEFSIRTDNGFTYRPGEDYLPDAVQSVLSRCFYFDCIVRTEGLYPIDLQERHEFENRSDLNLDFQQIYNCSLAEQVETALKIDSEVINPITAEWPLTAVVSPDKKGIDALPYLVYELAHICLETPPRYSGDEARKRVLNSFSQGTGDTRSTNLVFRNKAEFVDVPDRGGQQTVWVGDGIPLNASKFLTKGYENDTIVTDVGSSMDDDTSSSEIEIVVVCNEKRMGKESMDVRDVMNPQDDFSMNMTVYEQLSVQELRTILESETDYLHFIGHATPSGLECTDGILDVASIQNSGVTTFFLNACQSYHQGKKLVEKGSSGGIVTYSDVSDKYALKTSSLVCRLLNEGFTMGTCLSIVRDAMPIGRQYTLVGAHKSKVIQSEGITPYLRHISEIGNKYELKLTAYASGTRHMVGNLIRYDIEPITRNRLIPSSTTVRVDWPELKQFISKKATPVLYEDELLTRSEFFDAVDE